MTRAFPSPHSILQRGDSTVDGKQPEIRSVRSCFFDGLCEAASGKQRVPFDAVRRVVRFPSGFLDVRFEGRQCVVAERRLLELTLTGDEGLPRSEADDIDLVVVVPLLSRVGDCLLRIRRPERRTAEVLERLADEIRQFRFDACVVRILAGVSYWFPMP